MKTQFFLLLGILATVLFTGCEMTENPDGAGFQLIKDGEVVLDMSDIEYYDFSTHVIYLNENNRLAGYVDKLEGAAVTVDGVEIYSLRIQDPLSSTFYPGPQTNRVMDRYGDFAFRIRFLHLDDGSGNIPVDPRLDPRISDVLQRHDKLRRGLSVEIVSVERSGNDIKTTLRLKNLDPISYYHLDPDKMGTGLFHYFTNGLTFYNPEIPDYVYDRTAIESPDPWNYWTNDWLAEIAGNQTKEWEFTYSLGAVPQGKDLNFSFDFPSPYLAVTSRAALDLDGGRIWLGSVEDRKMVRF